MAECNIILYNKLLTVCPGCVANHYLFLFFFLCPSIQVEKALRIEEQLQSQLIRIINKRIYQQQQCEINHILTKERSVSLPWQPH